MANYMYLPNPGLEEDPPAREFVGPTNVLLARRIAKEAHGPGGRLFKEVVSAPSPWETRPSANSPQPNGCKIPVLHR